MASALRPPFPFPTTDPASIERLAATATASRPAVCPSSSSDWRHRRPWKRPTSLHRGPRAWPLAASAADSDRSLRLREHAKPRQGRVTRFQTQKRAGLGDPPAVAESVSCERWSGRRLGTWRRGGRRAGRGAGEHRTPSRHAAGHDGSQTPAARDHQHGQDLRELRRYLAG